MAETNSRKTTKMKIGGVPVEIESQEDVVSSASLVPANLANTIGNNTLFRAASVTADATTVSKLVEVSWRQRCQQQIDLVTEERKAAAKTAEDKAKAYQAAVAAIGIPEDFTRDVTALAAAFKVFHPDAVALSDDGRSPLDKHTPLAGSGGILSGVSVNLGAAKAMVVAAQVRGSGTRLADVMRTYSVPAAVLEAHTARVDADAAVSRLDGRLTELAKVKQTAGERGEAAYAAAAVNLLSETVEGQRILATIHDATGRMARKAGLPGGGDDDDLLAIATRTPVTRTKTDTPTPGQDG